MSADAGSSIGAAVDRSRLAVVRDTSDGPLHRREGVPNRNPSHLPMRTSAANAPAARRVGVVIVLPPGSGEVAHERGVVVRSGPQLSTLRKPTVFLLSASLSPASGSSVSVLSPYYCW